MFLKIIYKSEVNYVCCYQEKVLLSLLEDLLTLPICVQRFSISVIKYILKYILRLRKEDQSNILDNITVAVSL